MPTLVIVGAQWGDEAKGKIVDVLGNEAGLVVRYSGGNNAGHTVITGGQTFKFHLLPAGILHPGTTSILAGGMAICPRGLLEELDRTREQCPNLGELRISPAAHVVFPYHRVLDQLEETARGDNKIGTTSRGIGPMYTDKVQRMGIRMGEFVNRDRFEERLRHVLEFKNRLMVLLGGVPMDFDTIFDEYVAYADRLRPYVLDTEELLQEAVRRGEKILFEGAQGTFLDLDHGTYPYVTSSHPTAGGACLGTGIGPRDIDHVLGVAKAYTTRVGEGPFPTELDDAIGQQIRDQGNEYGTTTGRPRRCGWLDLVALRHSCRLNSLSGLILTRLDVLAGVGPIKVCTEYHAGGGPTGHLPYTLDEWAQIEPQFQELEGWTEDISGCRSWADLPASVQNYVKFVEEFTLTPAAILSIGPDRKETIILRPDLIWSGSPALAEHH
ncbi:adenylosuccinate synthase [Kamptonema cortianum]|nr:adenylosuccinate synthase [Geitlerinema splendidum]MDK3155250.1 adenylosuccinate synthase [Kamptonema cortianum]